MTTEFETALRREVRGDIYFDNLSRGIYATDASHYQIIPRCVVVPRSQSDAVAAVRLAGEFQVPITARGGGTSLSGQTTWTGLVLDMSRYMANILEVNLDERWARVQPGVVRDQLNQRLASDELQFAPDPATTSRATIGGMIGNNSSGTRSIVYGKTIDHVLECTVALADGSVCTFGARDPDRWRLLEAGQDRPAEIYRGVREIIEANREEIQRRFPKVMRRVSGYNLDAFVSSDDKPSDWNLANLVVGSEGTLAVLLEAKVKLVALPNSTAVCIVHFAEFFAALEAVPEILKYVPSAVELLDRKVIEESRQNPTTAALTGFFAGEPDAVLIVEFFADDDESARRTVQRFADDMQRHKVGYAWPTRVDAAKIQEVWELRKLGLGLIENLKGKKGKAFIEDACVPVEHLAEYVRKVYEICHRHGVGVTSYAHASVGVLHVRPELDLHDPEDVARMQKIADEVFPLVKSYDGSFSSEHGDGLVRGAFIPRFFGDQIYGAFRDVKQLFDPTGIMNPGKIIHAAPMTENLRYGPKYRPMPLQTQYHYRDHGSFQQAIEKCSGLGACRKIGTGVMCPSYMATRDEQHTTRGRSNALRMAMSGQLDGEDLTSQRVEEVLELCLACKACKSECPTAVDVARFKAEVTQLRYDKYGTPRSAKWVARLPQFLQRVPLPLAKGASWLQNKMRLDGVALKMLGFDERRSLPKLATKSFMTWYAEARAANHRDVSPRGQVALFVDTFTNYFEPHIGQAVIKLLEDCGYDVLATAAGCCQRTAISKGLLREAKAAGAKTVSELAAFHPETKLIAIEPSCASALTDDLPDLVDQDSKAQLVRDRVMLLEQFLQSEIEVGKLQGVKLRGSCQELLIHVHCHQKALYGVKALGTVLDRIPGLDWSIVEAGCCGMAGSFGYEHYDLSQQIGEDRLFPAIRARSADAEVATTGTSCRQQLRDFLDVDAKHWSEYIRVV